MGVLVSGEGSKFIGGLALAHLWLSALLRVIFQKVGSLHNVGYASAWLEFHQTGRLGLPIWDEYCSCVGCTGQGGLGPGTIGCTQHLLNFKP